MALVALHVDYITDIRYSDSFAITAPQQGQVTRVLTQLFKCSGLLINQNNWPVFILLSFALQKETNSDNSYFNKYKEKHVLCRFARVCGSSATSNSRHLSHQRF